MTNRRPPEDEQPKAPVPKPEVAAEATSPPVHETVEGVTAAEAAVASYERNNPESGEGE